MLKNGLFILALVTLPAAARATVLVDSLTTAQNLAISPGTALDSGGVASAAAIGNARWAALGTDGGANPNGASTATFHDSGNGLLVFTPHQDDAVRANLIYDGDAAGPHLTVDGNGLGAIDLAALGNLTFQLTARSTTEVDGVLFLYSFNSGNSSRYDFTFPGLGVDVPFSIIHIDLTLPDFVTGVGFQSNALGAIVLTIDTSLTTGIVQIDELRFVPEPASALLAALGCLALLFAGRLRSR